MIKTIKNGLLVVAIFCCMPVVAKIDNQGKQHFVVKHEFMVEQSLNVVFERFKQVSKWWEGEHSFSGNAANLYFDFDKERCFCEKMPNGGFVEHLQVIHVSDQKKVVFSGGLGPLQEHAVSGKLIWRFTEHEKAVQDNAEHGNAKQGNTEQESAKQSNQVKVSVEYRVFGHVVGGMEQWPKAVDFVLGVQVKRLKGLLE